MSRWHVSIFRSVVGLIACAGLVFLAACQTTTRRTVTYYQFSDVPVTNKAPQELLDAQNRMLKESWSPPSGNMIFPGQMVAPSQQVSPGKIVPTQTLKPTGKRQSPS